MTLSAHIVVRGCASVQPHLTVRLSCSVSLLQAVYEFKTDVREALRSYATTDF